MGYIGKFNITSINGYASNVYFSKNSEGNEPPVPPTIYLAQANGDLILQFDGSSIVVLEL